VTITADLPARRILFVHAHPDDETISGGATMAKYAAGGAHVTLVTCTLGEEGEIFVPELTKLAASEADQLGGYRLVELERACAAMGVTDHRFLGGAGRYRDSGMMFQESTDLNGDAWPGDPMDPRKGARAARPFRTAWTRSGRFRFEYVDSCDPGAARYVIWASGMDVRAGWGEASETSGPVALEHALGAASGVSWGVSAELPIVCLVGIKSAATIVPSGEETAELIGDECIMGRRCMRIRLDAPGRPPFGPANQTLWIDAETFLVRRIESTLTTAISEIHILVEYSPEANPSPSADRSARRR